MKLRPKGISVIICCFNSENRIEATLRHLVEQQTAEGLDWEIILIDNNSTDGTAKRAEQLMSQNGENIPFRIVNEQIPGLSYARNKGFEEAKFNIALMVDDDNSLCESYLQGIEETFSADDKIGMVGGLGIPALEVTPPAWFSTYAYCYATGAQQNGNEPIEHLYGAGLALRLDVLDRIKAAGFRSLLSDRTGTSLMSGGDTELCLAYRMAGFKLQAMNDLTFKHHLPLSRVNWKYLKRLFYGFGQTKARLDIYSTVMAGRPIPKKGKFPAWFNRFIFLTKNVMIDLPVLVGSIFLRMEGSNRLLYAIGKLGQIHGVLDIRQDYNQLFLQVQSLKESLKNG